MKYLVALLLLLLSGLAVIAAPRTSAGPAGSGPTRPVLAPSVRTLDRKNGFGEVTLGADVHTFRHLVLERADPSTQTVYYTRATENLQLDSYTVTGISYGFYKDKLCSIELRTMGDANCRGIHQFLLDAYGPSQRLASTKSEYWLGQQVSLRYTEVPQGYATVMLASKLLMDQRMAERKVPVYSAA